MKGYEPEDNQGKLGTPDYKLVAFIGCLYILAETCECDVQQTVIYITLMYTRQLACVVETTTKSLYGRLNDQMPVISMLYIYLPLPSNCWYIRMRK